MPGRCADDQGAVIVLVAILLGTAVLTGLLAIVVDLGRLYAERRVVQNSADAAALTLARNCGLTDPQCATRSAAQTRALSLAAANSPDGVSAVTEVCGSGVLGPCTAPGTDWMECGALTPQQALGYARVRTQTQAGSGDRFLLPFFAGAVGGTGTNQMTTVACAQAIWGPPSTSTVLMPFLLPACPGAPGGSAVVIEDFDPNSPDQSCTVNGVTYNPITKGMAFAAFPGASKDCTTPVSVAVGDVIRVETSLQQLCGSGISAVLNSYIASKTALTLPVVGAHANNGQGVYTFTILSFKSFTILGYNLKNLSGGAAPPGGWNSTVCKTAKRSCLYGVVGTAATNGTPGTGPNLGVISIQLTP